MFLLHEPAKLAGNDDRRYSAMDEKYRRQEKADSHRQPLLLREAGKYFNRLIWMPPGQYGTTTSGTFCLRQ